MTREEAVRILGQYDVSAIQFYETDGREIPWDKGHEALEMAIEALAQLPSARPEQHPDEWCTDCREYDKERHCCPRFNRVIRETIKEMRENERDREGGDEMDRANVIKFMKELWRETVPNTYAEQAFKTAIELLRAGSRWIPCSERLPEEDDGKYLVTSYCESIKRSRVHVSSCYVNHCGIWSDVFLGYRVIAWMPLPEPYEPEE